MSLAGIVIKRIKGRNTGLGERRNKIGRLFKLTEVKAEGNVDEENLTPESGLLMESNSRDKHE